MPTLPEATKFLGLASLAGYRHVWDMLESFTAPIALVTCFTLSANILRPLPGFIILFSWSYLSYLLWICCTSVLNSS